MPKMVTGEAWGMNNESLLNMATFRGQEHSSLSPLWSPERWQKPLPPLTRVTIQIVTLPPCLSPWGSMTTVICLWCKPIRLTSWLSTLVPLTPPQCDPGVLVPLHVLPSLSSEPGGGDVSWPFKLALEFLPLLFTHTVSSIGNTPSSPPLLTATLPWKFSWDFLSSRRGFPVLDLGTAADSRGLWPVCQGAPRFFFFFFANPYLTACGCHSLASFFSTKLSLFKGSKGKWWVKQCS